MLFILNRDLNSHYRLAVWFKSRFCKLRMFWHQAVMFDGVIFFNFRSGLNGIQLPSWNASNPASMCSDWEGITCSNGRVTELRLPTLVTYAINGTISPAVANLTELRRLELPAFVDIIGEFPPQIWSLPNLRSVYLAVPVEVRFPSQVSQNLWGVYVTLDSLNSIYL